MSATSSNVPAPATGSLAEAELRSNFDGKLTSAEEQKHEAIAGDVSDKAPENVEDEGKNLDTRDDASVDLEAELRSNVDGKSNSAEEQTLEEQRGVTDLETKVRIPTEAPAIRDWYVERNAVVAKVCERLGVGRSTHHSSEEPRMVGLTGPRGVGKSTVASMVLNRQDVRASFHNGVLWLQVGQGAKDHLSELMLRLADMVYETVMLKECRAPRLSGLDSEPEDGVAYIREVMLDQRSRSFLVVADDVWEVQVLEELERAGLWVLYTTRHHDILPEAPLRVHQVMEEEESILGDSFDVVCTLHGLGCDADTDKRVEEAEYYFRRALAIQEDKLDSHHRDFLAKPFILAKTLHNLAVCILRAGRKEEAEVYLLRALAILEEIDHPDAVDTLDLVGKVVGEEQRLEEAEGYFQRALSIQEKNLGVDHPGVATTLFNLGAAAGMAGRKAEAGKYYQRALAIQEKNLDVDHPDVAKTLDSLGALLHDAESERAEELHLRALAIRENNLGVDHPDLVSTLDDLGSCAGRAGRTEEARKYFSRSLAIQERTLGSDHPNVASTFKNLGLCACNSGRRAEAEEYYQRALVIDEKHLGVNHLDVANTLRILGAWAGNAGRMRKAEDYCGRALAIWEQHPGVDHPYIATTLSNLALCAEHAGRTYEAKKLYRRALVIQEKDLGVDHPKVVETREKLGKLTRMRQKRGWR